MKYLIIALAVSFFVNFIQFQEYSILSKRQGRFYDMVVEYQKELREMKKDKG